MKKKVNNKEEGYTDKQITVALNNAIIYTLNPIDGIEVRKPDKFNGSVEEFQTKRLRKLRAYAKAVIEGLVQDVEDGHITYRELVAVFTSAALYVQLQHVQSHDQPLPVDDLIDKIKRS